MSTEFWLGVLTLPVAALVFVGLGLLGERVRLSWTTWKPQRVSNYERRANLAVGVALANRLLQVRLPGGYVFIYRARMNRWCGNRHMRATAVVRDALDEALKGEIDE